MFTGNVRQDPSRAQPSPASPLALMAKHLSVKFDGAGNCGVGWAGLGWWAPATLTGGFSLPVEWQQQQQQWWIVDLVPAPGHRVLLNSCTAPGHCLPLPTFHNL